MPLTIENTHPDEEPWVGKRRVPVNDPIAILRAALLTLSAHVHVTEHHAGEWRDCQVSECTAAWSAADRALGEEPHGQ